MSIRIEVESLGLSRRDFDELRDELIARNECFDRSNLRWLAYDHLYLAAIANAGPAACGMKTVAEEKQERRRRFIDMHPDELLTCHELLKTEGMWDDVRWERTHRTVPNWNALTSRQKAWVKLNCVINHLDSPTPRLGEVITLLQKCEEERSLPTDVITTFVRKLKTLLSVYPEKLTMDGFREKLIAIADTLLDFLPDEERQTCEREELQNYSCTSNCYRVLL